MSHFQWYKNSSLTRLYGIAEAYLDYLKVHFKSRLPKVFFESMKNRTRDKNNGDIPYSDLSYRYVILEIKAKGLE